MRREADAIVAVKRGAQTGCGQCGVSLRGPAVGYLSDNDAYAAGWLPRRDYLCSGNVQPIDEKVDAGCHPCFDGFDRGTGNEVQCGRERAHSKRGKGWRWRSAARRHGVRARRRRNSSVHPRRSIRSERGGYAQVPLAKCHGPGAPAPAPPFLRADNACVRGRPIEIDDAQGLDAIDNQQPVRPDDMTNAPQIGETRSGSQLR